MFKQKKSVKWKQDLSDCIIDIIGIIQIWMQNARAPIIYL